VSVGGNEKNMIKFFNLRFGLSIKRRIIMQKERIRNDMRMKSYGVEKKRKKFENFTM
jgi:hypothetical protein